jgi:antitoxin (DNA-binding transcriptional repressor) of toxin-antitoxin stability system
MKSVGIKQLKSRLSEYLRLVRNGETVFVTDRDEVVAELRPTHRQAGTADSLDELWLSAGK